MRYLLDTHAILWYVDAAQELPLGLRDLIDSSECVYSVVSLWEIAIKQSLGRLNRGITILDYDGFCRSAGFRSLQILPTHLDRIRALPDIHRDPSRRACRVKPEKCGAPRSGCFRADAETGATSRQVAAQEILSCILVPNAEI